MRTGDFTPVDIAKWSSHACRLPSTSMLAGQSVLRSDKWTTFLAGQAPAGFEVDGG